MKEEGGELAAVEDEEGVELVTPELAVLEGMVYDSTRAAPFSGARIRLSGTEHRVLADRTGRFRLVAPTEGRFELLEDSLQAPLHAGHADREGMFALCSVPAGSYRVAATVYGVTEVVDSIRLRAAPFGSSGRTRRGGSRWRSFRSAPTRSAWTT